MSFTNSHISIVLAVVLAWLPGVAWAAGVEITHLGNEGFLLAAGEKKVLIDALYGEGLRGYPVVPKELRRQLETAEGPYAGVDLVLASHYHPDHFHPASVARHLEANPGALFVSTEQAAARVLSQGIAAERVRGFWPAEGVRETVEHAGIRLTVLRLHHGETPAQNLGLLIEIGGVEVLHMGDTEIRPGEAERLGLADEGIDVALAPYWYFLKGHYAPVLDRLGGPRLVAMHFPAAGAPAAYFESHGDLEGLIEVCQARRPEAWMAFETGDSRRFEVARTRER